MSAGKRFEYELRKSLTHQLNSWTQRIPDKTYGRGNMSHKTPADMLCITSGLDMLIECKSTSIKKSKSIPFNRVYDHQLNELIKFDELSQRHMGLLALHFYNGERGKARVHRAWLVPISWWVSKLRRGERKSVPLNDIAVSPQCWEMVWAKPDGWEKNGWVLPLKLMELCARPAPVGGSHTHRAEATASIVGHHIDNEWMLPLESESSSHTEQQD